MDVTQYPKLTLTETIELVLDTVSVNHPSLILGPPGGGKTAIAMQIAQAIRYEYVPLELGLTVPEEIGGVPARDPATGTIVRFPLGPLKRASEVPCVLHIDEVTRADAVRQGAAMTGINERRWGDVALHPETIIILTGNEPDSGGTFTILDALLNRCCVVRMNTTRDETRQWLNQLGAPGSTLRALAEDLSLTSEARPTLIAETPPEGFAEAGALWASGRAITNGLKRLAARLDRLKLDANADLRDDKVAFTHMAGCIGIESTAMWFTLRGLRGKLPTRDEVVASPKGAKLPSDFESAIASLTLLIEIEKVSPDAAWLYLGRYGDDLAEVRAVAARKMQGSAGKLKDKDATVAFNRLIASVAKAMQSGR